jgi:membrane protease YdiL (CAAX protease family)
VGAVPLLDSVYTLAGVITERLRLPPDSLVAGDAENERTALVVLLAATVLLVVFYYWGRPGFYFRSGLIDGVAGTIGGPFADHPSVGGYVWWGASSLVLRVAAPLAVIVWVLRKRPADFGFRLRGIGSHLPVYGLMYAAILPLLILASGLESFQSYYPFYDEAAEGGVAFWLYEAGYLVQFVGVEAFFRGFLVFGLRPRLGPTLAIVSMTVPYTMIHFAKPAPEAFAAIGAGLILGYMALRSRSFVPGVLLHAGVALTMDVLVLARTDGLAGIL